MARSTKRSNASILSAAKIHKFVGLAASLRAKAKVTSKTSQASTRGRKARKPETRGRKGKVGGGGGDYDGDDDSDTENRGMKAAKAIVDKSGLSDLSESEYVEPPSWKDPEKRKRTDEEKKERKPYVFHYNCANGRNTAPKIVYPQDRKALHRLATRPWVQEAKAAQQVAQTVTTRTYITMDHVDPEEEEDIGFTQPFATLAPRVLPKDTMPIKDRKRFFIYTPTAAMKKAMRADVSEVHGFFNPINNIGDCLFHPHPPPLGPRGKMRGYIKCEYRWRDEFGIHGIVVNYGITGLLVNFCLTAAQKEGFIEEAWHLSYLCGNWTCCNWRHQTIEDGPTNISRNGCFGSTKECVHKPRCIKDKKRKLVLPPHKSKVVQATLPGMTDADAENAEAAEISKRGSSNDGEGDDEAEIEEAELNDEEVPGETDISKAVGTHAEGDTSGMADANLEVTEAPGISRSNLLGDDEGGDEANVEGVEADSKEAGSDGEKFEAEPYDEADTSDTHELVDEENEDSWSEDEGRGPRVSIVS